MKLFGTDGIRGIAGTELTGDLAYRLGLSLGIVLSETDRRPLVIVGRDTRISGKMLEEAVARGLSETGADVLLAGVVPTPAVAFLVIKQKASAGVMISASHNPAEYNGIKVFSSQGFKLSDPLEERVEELILGEIKADPEAEKGSVNERVSLKESYIKHVRELLPPVSGRRIVFDSANGSASATVREIFGDGFDYLNDRPDGININLECGSTKMDGLRRAVVKNGYDLGIAFDGDADRCLLCDENGRIIDGDMIISALAAEMNRSCKLNGRRVVVTKLSNLGFHRMMDSHGIKVEQTDVGDRYVLERMNELNASLGGEQSGHIILREYATTGDGQITAAACLGLMAKYPAKKASEIFGEMKRLPQVSLNVSVPNELKSAVIFSDAVCERRDYVEKMLGSSGRIILRPSGTEPIVRVMLEGENIDEITDYADMMKKEIEETVSVAGGRMA